MTGERIDTREGKELGLVARVFPPEHLVEETMKVAKLLASRNQVALRSIKHLVGRGLDMDLRNACSAPRRKPSPCVFQPGQEGGCGGLSGEAQTGLSWEVWPAESWEGFSAACLEPCLREVITRSTHRPYKLFLSRPRKHGGHERPGHGSQTENPGENLLSTPGSCSKGLSNIYRKASQGFHDPRRHHHFPRRVDPLGRTHQAAFPSLNSLDGFLLLDSAPFPLGQVVVVPAQTGWTFF